MTQPPSDQRPADRPATTLSYEEARDQLVEIVRQLESGSAGLSRSLELWERGEELATICQQWLDGAKARLGSVQATTEPTG